MSFASDPPPPNLADQLLLVSYDRQLERFPGPDGLGQFLAGAILMEMALRGKRGGTSRDTRQWIRAHQEGNLGAGSCD